MSLFFTIVAGIIIRLIFFTGMYTNDDYKYAQHAYELLQIRKTMEKDISLYEEYIKTGHKFFIPPTKLFFPLYIPVGILYGIFGVHTWTTFLWPFLCSIGKIAVIFFIAVEIFHNVDIAIMSSILLSFFPLSTIFATRLTPDEISNFLTGLTVLLFLKGIEKKSIAYVAGIMLGITYMVRCYVLILFPLFFVYILWRRKTIATFFSVIAGFLTIFAIENIFFFYLHIVKDIPFIFRLKVERDMMFYLNRVMAPKSSIALIKEFPPSFFDFHIMGIYYYMFILGLVYIIFRKSIKDISIPFVWFGYYLLCLWFLPIDWKTYLLPMRDPRYLDMLSIPMILIMAFFIERYCRGRLLKRAVIILLLTTSFWSMAIQIYISPSEKYNTESFRLAADILRRIPPKDLYCDNPSVSTKINYYFRYSLPFRIIRSVKLTPEIRDVYVLIHDFRNKPPLDRQGIIDSIRKGHILGGRTAHLRKEGFDLSRWVLLNVIKGRGGPYMYLFYIPD